MANYAAQMIHAQPVTARLEGQAIRQAQKASESNIRHQEALTAESEARTAKAKAGPSLKERLEVAESAVTFLGDAEARTLEGYNAKIAAGTPEPEARQWAQASFETSRRMARHLGVYEAIGADPRENEQLQWDPQAAQSALATRDETMKRITKAKETLLEQDVKIAEEGRANTEDDRRARRDEGIDARGDYRAAAIDEKQARLDAELEVETEARKAGTASGTLTETQRGKIQQDLDGLELALNELTKLRPRIGDAVGIDSKIAKGAATVGGQSEMVLGEGVGAIAPETITAYQQLSQFNENAVGALAKSSARGLKEQERILQNVLIKPGSAGLNAAQANLRLDEIEKYLTDAAAMKRKQLGGETKQPARPGQGGVKPIESDADYDALPSGTVFVGPDGKRRKKP